LCVMKVILSVLGFVLLTSFSGKKVDVLDGIWTGVYRADNVRERVLVRFDDQNGVELYNGEVEDSNKFTGTYELVGDTLLKFSYQTPDGKNFSMHGTVNKKRTYVDGTWEASDKLTGSFYLKKEKIEEMFVQP
jgi:hypothetical protein